MLLQLTPLTPGRQIMIEVFLMEGPRRGLIFSFTSHDKFWFVCVEWKKRPRETRTHATANATSLERLV